MKLTQERLKQLLDYDPVTGDFTWKVERGGTNIGDIAGHTCYKNTKQYTLIGIDRSLYRAHRLVWLHVHGRFPKQEIDHINGNGTDNSLGNLREVDRKENCKNMRLHNHNTSGISGVSWRKQRSSWRAYVTVGNKQVSLGHFDNLFDACCARKSAERALGFHANHGSDRPL